MTAAYFTSLRLGGHRRGDFPLGALPEEKQPQQVSAGVGTHQFRQSTTLGFQSCGRAPLEADADDVDDLHRSGVVAAGLSRCLCRGRSPGRGVEHRRNHSTARCRQPDPRAPPAGAGSDVSRRPGALRVGPLHPRCPTRSAFFGGSVLPARISGSALGSPISRGRRTVPPHPGRMPSFTSGRPMEMEGSSAATRDLHASASSSPPPRQSPLIAATVGMGSRAIRSKQRLTLGEERRHLVPVILRISNKSAPATNESRLSRGKDYAGRLIPFDCSHDLCQFRERLRRHGVDCLLGRIEPEG